jgi:hypothetical protein
MTITSPPIPTTDQEAQALFEEAHRRRRWRRLLLAGSLVAVLCAGGIVWWSMIGGNTPPPSQGAATGSPSSPAPSKGGPLSVREIDHWTFRVYGSPSGNGLSPVNASYELTDPEGQLKSSGSGVFGASLLARPGVVHELGGGDNGPGEWSVGYYQITLPSITSVRVMSGQTLLDAMTPVSVDRVRFVVLAVEGSTKNVTVKGLDAARRVVSSVPFSFSPPPVSQKGHAGTVGIRPSH